MQLKNNRTGNSQLYYWEKKPNKEPALQLIHIPAGATVEIEDNIFSRLTASFTTIEVQDEVITDIETGASPIELDRKPAQIKEYYSSGKTREVNLLRESIRRGEYSIIEGVVTSNEEMAKVLNKNGVSVKDMKPEDIKALYEKLA